MATPFQMLNMKPAGFQQNGMNANGQMGNAVSGGGLGGGGIGAGPSTGGLNPNSPIGQWMTQNGFQATNRDPSQDPALAQAWNQLGGQQQLGMLNSNQGGAGLYDSLIQGGNNQAGMGQFMTQGNYNTGFGQNAGNLAAYSGQQG